MSKISSAYAQALYGIALEQGQLELYQDDLKSIQQALKENENFYDLPKEEQKRLLIADLTEKVPIDVLHFLEVLVDNNRFSHLNAIIDDFHYLVNDYFGIMEAVVTSATDLKEQTVGQIAKALSKKFGKEVRVQTETDPSLISGYRVRIDDFVYDNSLKLHLKELKKKLLSAEY